MRWFFSEGCEYDPEALRKLGADAQAANKLEALRKAFEASETWDEAGVRTAVESAGSAVGVAPGKMMFPLRVAVTGSMAGPDLTASLVLLGKDRVIRRLSEAGKLLTTATREAD
jgi:glutamyl/glutaminyl-tRNA synthetase